MANEFALFAPVILPLVGAAAVLVSKAFLSGRAASVLETSAMLAGLVLPWISLALVLPELLEGKVWSGWIGGWSPLVAIAYRYDGMTWLVHALGFSLAGVAWLYSRGAGPRGHVFSAVFLVQTTALAATAMTADLFNLFVCLEMLGLSSYVLIASSDKSGAVLASFSYLLVSAMSMVLFLVGAYGLYRLTGALSYEGVRAGLLALSEAGRVQAGLSVALVASAIAIRVAVMPVYGWLPDSHALAPHAVSAVLSGVLIKTPLFALYRLLATLPMGADAGRLLGWAGAVTAIVAVVVALSQRDAKRLLAYHSISQIGYVVAAWGAALASGAESEAGVFLVSAAFFHAFCHALFKGLLFLSVGHVIDRCGERDVYRLRGAAATLGAGGERFPVTLCCFAAGAFSIAAFPPFNGYASKAFILHGLDHGWQYWALVVAGVGTVASFVKLSRVFWPLHVPRSVTTDSPATPPVTADSAGATPAGDAMPPAPRSILAAQVLLALACVASGIGAPWLFAFVLRLFSFSSGGASGAQGAVLPGSAPGLYSPDAWLKTGIVALAGALCYALAVHTPIKRLLACIRDRDRAFHGLFLAFAAGLAALAAWLTLAPAGFLASP